MSDNETDIELPQDWSQESYPSIEQEWLEASFVAPAFGSAVAVLTADSHSEGAVVYPLAVTTDINQTVDDREYGIVAVADDRNGAVEYAEAIMTHVRQVVEAQPTASPRESLLDAVEAADVEANVMGVERRTSVDESLGSSDGPF